MKSENIVFDNHTNMDPGFQVNQKEIMQLHKVSLSIAFWLFPLLSGNLSLFHFTVSERQMKSSEACFPCSTKFLVAGMH